MMWFVLKRSFYLLNCEQTKGRWEHLKEDQLEAAAVVQERDDGDLDTAGDNRGDEKQTD